jgi:anaerobic magnesium-protoporphyrin IX monomethyl ester cyclase
MQGDRILFIIPPYLPFEEYHPQKAGQKLPTLTPPYGVLSIIAYINTPAKYEIEILDINDMLVNLPDVYQDQIVSEIKLKLKTFNPKYICISALFNTCFPHLKYIAAACKENNPDCVLLVGGGLATNLYKDVFNEVSEIDALCFGEGEIPFKSLLESQISVECAHKISHAWITKRSIETDIYPQYDFVQDLDEIPIVDFSYINLRKYNGRSYIDKDNKDKIEVSIHTSRGCPFNCCYCANGTVHGKKIRRMSTGMVLQTIRNYIDNYKMDILLIEDDHFLADKPRALYILSVIKELHVNVEFPNGVAVFQIDDDIARAFGDCGVKVLPLAIESGSDNVLKNIIHKPLRKEQVFNAVRALKKYDIRLHAFIIIGFPNEYDNDRKESLDILLDTEIDWAHVFIVVPIAGSRLYKQCKESDYLLTNDYNQYTVSKCNIKAPGVDPQQIESYAYYMNVVVNYVRNSNFKNGRYEICKSYFQNVVNHYPNQAIAHYMLYKTCGNLNECEKAEQHYDIFRTIIKDNEFYRELVNTLREDGYKFDGI